MVLALAVLCAMMFLAWPSSAGAHAELAEAQPEPGSALAALPETVSLVFTESVDPQLSSVALLAADGAAVSLGALSLDPADSRVLVVPVLDASSEGAGTFTVVWSVVSSEDDHPSSGSFTFSSGTGMAPVQEGTDRASASSAAVIGRWLELIGIVLLSGLGFFAASTRLSVAFEGHRRLDPFAALALTALVGAVESLRAREIAITGEPFFGSIEAETLTRLAGSTYGISWIVRVVALMVVLCLALGAGDARRQVTDRAITLLGVLAIASLAISGHASAVGASVAAMTADLLHMSGAAVWLGGLLGIVLVVGVPADSEAYRNLLRTQGNRFVLAVGVIVAAGVVSAWWQVSGRRGLTGTTYGRTLLIKIAIVAAILGIAYYNRRVLQHDGTRLKWTPFATGLELALALFVLLLSADLSQLAPANGSLSITTAARAIELNATGSSGDLTTHMSGVLTGDPSDVISIDVAPDSGLQRLIVRTTLTDAESGVVIGDRFDADPVPNAPGRFQFPAGRLGVAGEWRLDVTARRQGMEDEIVTFEVDSSTLESRGTALADDHWGGVRMTPHAILALLLAVLMLVVGLGGLRRITGLEPLASGFLLATSLLIAGGFLVSAARGLATVTPEHTMVNPVSADPPALTYAGELYRLNCAACHGADGKGSGEVAHLHGDGADLTQQRTVEQSDGDLRFWIARGVPGSEMPAFSAALTEDEQWTLVNYLRQLQDAASVEAANQT